MGKDPEVTDDFVALIVCDKMGWTYDEFVRQPPWLIGALQEKWALDKQYGVK